MAVLKPATRRPRSRAIEAEAHRRDSLPALHLRLGRMALAMRKRQARSLFQGRDRAAEGPSRGLRRVACLVGRHCMKKPAGI